MAVRAEQKESNYRVRVDEKALDTGMFRRLLAWCSHDRGHWQRLGCGLLPFKPAFYVNDGEMTGLVYSTEFNPYFNQTCMMSVSFNLNPTRSYLQTCTVHPISCAIADLLPATRWITPKPYPSIYSVASAFDNAWITLTLTKAGKLCCHQSVVNINVKEQHNSYFWPNVKATI